MTVRYRLLTALTVMVGAAASLVGCSSADRVVDVEPTQTADYGTNMVGCLSAKGWDVVRNDHGGLTSSVPEEQNDQFMSDREDCKAEFGYDGEFSVTAEQAGSFYDKLVASAECLRGLGYEISDPPSRQSFVETLVGGELPDWAPYSELLEMTGSIGAAQRAEATCPQPSSW